MAFLTEQRINCPFCGESMVILLDPTDNGHEYIEDCQICCRPITMHVSSGVDGEPMAQVSDDG